MRNCVATLFSKRRLNGADRRFYSARTVGGSALCRLGIGTLVLGGVALFGADWRDKPSSDWTADEVTKILNDSPWAQQVHMERSDQGRGDWSARNGGGGGGGGGWGGRGGGMGGPGGGGWGGPGGGGGGGGWGGNRGGGQGRGTQQGGARQVVIRWQSAAPVQQALAKQQGSATATAEAPATPNAQAQATPAASPDTDYIIAVAGLPDWQGGRRQDAGGNSGSSGQSDEDRRQAFLDRMKESTTLTAKGKSPLGPEKVERAADGTILFYFPKSEQPLSLDDNDVEFATRLGPMDLKHKFKLKDMKYQGKLAL